MATFPITAEQYDDLGDGKRMETTVYLTSQGQLHVETHTWTSNWVVGFTGGVVVSLLDATDTVVTATDVHTFGVDAKSIFWARSSRTDYFDQWISPEDLGRTERIVIWQAHTPRDRFYDIVNEAVLKGKALIEAFEIFRRAFA